MVAVALPPSLAPMQPMLGKPFHRPGWVYEEKCDGWRMLAFKMAGVPASSAAKASTIPSASASSPTPSPR